MGTINVYTGPMKCGKSQKIFDEIDRQLIAGKNIKVFSPSIDHRFGGNKTITSRARKSYEAIPITDIKQIKEYEADTYFIDEFQFLEGDIKTIEELAQEGKRFYIAGLNLTAEKKPFGKMGDLLCIADHITTLTSVCDVCKSENAVFTFFKGKKDSEYLNRRFRIFSCM